MVRERDIDWDCSCRIVRTALRDYFSLYCITDCPTISLRLLMSIILVYGAAKSSLASLVCTAITRLLMFFRPCAIDNCILNLLLLALFFF